MSCYGVLWRFMAFYGVLWRVMVFYGMLWRVMVFYGELKIIDALVEEYGQEFLSLSITSWASNE